MRQTLLSVLLLIAAFSAASSAAAQEGKYYLVYRVTTLEVKVGAEVEVEPLLLTNGNDFIFVYDYCRQYYVDKTQKLAKLYNFKVPPRLRREQFGEDPKALHDYCDEKPVTLVGGSYVLRNNHGAAISVSDVRFESRPDDWYRGRVRSPVFPYGKSTVKTVQGEIKPKYPAAVQAKQPYLFLMSASAALLDRIIPGRHPSPAETKSLQEQLKRYQDLRARGEKTNPPVQECKYSGHGGTNIVRIMGWDRETTSVRIEAYPTKTPPRVAELLYSDFDGDSRTDLVAVLEESQQHPVDAIADGQAAVRVFFGAGTEYCPLRYRRNSPASPVKRPVLMLKLGACNFLSMKLEGGGNTHDLIPVYGTGKACVPTSTARLYERVD